MVELLRYGEVAEAVGVTTQTVRKWIEAGTFPPADAKVGARPRWRRETVETWLAGGGSKEVAK